MSSGACQDVHTLASFLYQRHPHDILMPVREGTKHPQWAHCSHTWSWHKFFSYIGSPRRKAQDLCLILSDLCVLDVDGQDRVRELESRFAAHLRDAPCTLTARGRHYWFLRPVEADEEGFFDGAAQRIPGVDFKSVCRTGTGGVVVVPPSSGKTWSEGGALWQRPLRPMPPDLLREVAVPRYVCSTRLRMELLFYGPGADGPSDRLETSACKHLQGMAYFEPFLSGGGDMVAAGADGSSPLAVPVPCARSDFEDLLAVLDGRVPAPPPALPRRIELAWLARKLGVAQQERFVHDLATGAAMREAALFALCPEMWTSLRAERAEDPPPALDVDAAMAARLTYSPLDCPEGSRHERLLPDCIEGAPHGLRAGDRVLFANPGDAMQTACDPRVLGLLRRFPGRVVLAGGAVLAGTSSAVAAAAAAGSGAAGGRGVGDYDLFLAGVADAREADAILAEAWRLLTATEVETTVAAVRQGGEKRAHVMSTLRAGGRRGQQPPPPRAAVRTGNAVTMVIPPLFSPDELGEPRGGRGGGGTKEDVVVQVVLRLHASPMQALSAFDFGPCKVGCWWEGGRDGGPEGGLVVRAAPSWLPAMRHMAFHVDLQRWSVSSPSRVMKYVTKGFEAYVPGLDPAVRLREDGMAGLPLDGGRAANKLLRDAGVGALFRMERNIMKRRATATVFWWRTEQSAGAAAGKQRVWLAWPEALPDLCWRMVSDYETAVHALGTIKYVVHSILRRGVSWVHYQTDWLLHRLASLSWPVPRSAPPAGEGRPANGQPEGGDPLPWPRYDPLRPCMQHVDPQWHLVCAPPVAAFGLLRPPGGRGTGVIRL